KEDPVQPKNPVAFHYKPTVTIANLVSQGMNKQDIMDNNTIKSIMEKSFYHLENVGYRMDYTRACHALSQYGCTWDNTSNMVKFPQESIYRAIEHFQSKEKTKTPSVLLAGSCRQRLLEWEKKLTREGGIEDAKKIIQLFNFLPSVDFSSCGIYPLDVPKDAVDLVNTALLCKYSAKPFIQEIYSLDSAKLILEMLRILQGSKQEKINKMVCIMRSSSMQYKKIPLQLAELWHQEEYPIWITSSFITQNAQYYPTLCQVLCEWLAGIVYIASLGGNSPCLLHWDSCNVYNENSLFFSPEQAKIALGLQQISQTLGFPCFANLGPNLSWWDFQTGWEKGCAGVFSYIQQSSWASYAGILGEDFSPEQLVLDNFIANIIKKWQEKMQNSMETMPVEKLCEMARQRVFPGKKHEALELSGLLGDSFYKEKEDILGTIHRHIKQIFEEQNHPCLLSYDIEKEIERLVQIRYEQLGV
ncbi:MAG: trimethylamine methyltransferase family protein, partial [Candidatus Brocadiae bacterium]|nr:trimethylamine methyltransferase family protein [Candidatus Brocadiia bacterium]